MQGDEWDAYVVLDTCRAARNAGSPPGRAPYGDGVLVVVDGVTPVQGARESRVQGAAAIRSFEMTEPVRDEGSRPQGL